MNKISIVKNNVIPFDSSNIIICNNNISILDSGNYVLEYIDCDDVKLNIHVDKNKCINLFEYSYDNDISVNNKYNIDKKASLIINKFYCNKNSNENIDINLNGENVFVKYNFSSISNGIDKYKINIYHNAKKTNSDIFNKTIAKESSSNYFDINSYVENGIIDTYLNQSTKIITLGDSDNRINPNMYTYDNSTTAVHSSVIGSVSEDELFYLMSRGISYDESIRLIVKGTLLSNINIPCEYWQEINDIIDTLGGE